MAVLNWARALDVSSGRRQRVDYHFGVERHAYVTKEASYSTLSGRMLNVSVVTIG